MVLTRNISLCFRLKFDAWKELSGSFSNVCGVSAEDANRLQFSKR